MADRLAKLATVTYPSTPLVHIGNQNLNRAHFIIIIILFALSFRTLWLPWQQNLF